MDFDLRQAIAGLSPNEVFTLANQARPAGDYLFNAILPNRNEDTYDIDESSMTIRTTMAGMSGMDSRFAEGGAAERSELKGKTGKITIASRLPEELLRKLQRTMQALMARGGATNDAIQTTALNFFNKIILQAILDREEWLKGQALFTGAIDWTFNGIRLEADYGIPTANKFATRTGTSAYGGSASVLWDDHYAAMEILNWDVRAIICHPTTLKAIMANADVNQLQFVTSEPRTGVFKFRRLVSRSGNTQLDSDPRAELTIIAYNGEGEVYDLVAKGETTKVPFCPIGAMLYVGAPVGDKHRFIVGDGSTPSVDESKNRTDVAIGYGHVGPTVEGGGTPGRWGRVYTPENLPWQIEGEGAENFLPVIQAPKRLVITSTDV